MGNYFIATSVQHQKLADWLRDSVAKLPAEDDGLLAVVLARLPEAIRISQSWHAEKFIDDISGSKHDRSTVDAVVGWSVAAARVFAALRQRLDPAESAKAISDHVGASEPARKVVAWLHESDATVTRAVLQATAAIGAHPRFKDLSVTEELRGVYEAASETLPVSFEPVASIRIDIDAGPKELFFQATRVDLEWIIERLRVARARLEQLNDLTEE